jgi:transcriptional regulator with XRE-family HTH domain
MPEPVDLQVGQTIRMLRLKREMSQEDLAVGCGVTFQQIQKYEKGTNRVSASRLVQIANVLGADVKVFFDGTQTPSSNNDNLLPKELMTRQGLALIKAFHSIPDGKVRTRILGLVQTVASRQTDDVVDDDID